MTINFEIPEFIQQQTQMIKWVAESTMRTVARDLDEREHERPTAFVETMWPIVRDQQASALAKLHGTTTEPTEKRERPSTRVLGLMLLIEMLSWGDAALVGGCRDLPVPA